MHKILTIAVREYQAMVATKAFLVAIALMPILMLGGALAPGTSSRDGNADSADHRHR
ncbi:MAG UNVERIFIED_CONTAM: hypothetical protein LVR18_26685 [Planctomycetaceae bacterium]|jgi:ABC-type Na+ efflux pump permease subunit